MIKLLKNLLGTFIATGVLAAYPLTARCENYAINNANTTNTIEQETVFYRSKGGFSDSSNVIKRSYTAVKETKKEITSERNIEEKEESKPALPIQVYQPKYQAQIYQPNLAKPEIQAAEQKIENEIDFGDIFGFYYGVGLGIGGGNLKAKQVPKEYLDVPVHPKDHYVYSETASLDLEGKSCGFGQLYAGGDIGLPLKALKFIRAGYKANVLLPLGGGSSSNYQSPGSDSIQDKKFYRTGARAKTYSRIEVPNFLSSFLFYLDVPIKCEDGYFFLRAGISEDIASSSIEKGWERYGRDETMLKDKISLRGTSQFLSIGIGDELSDDESKIGSELTIKQNNLKGKTSYGDVELGGILISLGFRGSF